MKKAVIRQVSFYFKEGNVIWEPETDKTLNHNGKPFKWRVYIGIRRTINTNASPNMTNAKRLLLSK